MDVQRPAGDGRPAADVGAAPRDGRLTELDVLRGLCIVSMATAHLAAGSVSWQLLHAAVWIDGAVGFVFLSGLVLGMVQRGRVDRRGPAAASRAVLRRTGVVYAGHVALCLLAFAVVALDPARSARLGSVELAGGTGPALLSTLTLRINPAYASILSLYVVLLLGALLGTALLRRGLWPVVLGLSAVLYAVGLIWPTPFTFTPRPGVPGAVNAAAWQLLFALALCLGWAWRSPRVRAWVGRPDIGLAAAGLVVLLAVAAWWIELTQRTPPAAVRLVFGEGTLGPGTIAMAVLAFLALLPAARWATRVAPAVMSPLARIGRHSLDCYLILSTVVLVTPSLFRADPSSPTGDLLVLEVLLVCWMWSLLRDRWAGRSRARPGTAAVSGRPAR
ncbi:OpgC domain-containing protein [Nakamurella flavida]|uniref:OpgC domain-containing protein n=1 Tax=Nakamurella flavida TaxID=363630 RepID=A0A938YQV1_9ACTN|nr:OpgC domain-containing protein [Nakamurella flavida]MBM9477777.1 OpgC domain-containing protein [Nakamurella flavida]MDP9779330.1 hypothetical protein [Nakamurella flavida]